jgi:hypothetical protein
MMKEYLRIGIIMLAVSVVLSVACQHYTFTPNLPAYIKKINVPIFKNNTFKYGLESELTRIVTDQFISDGHLEIVNEAAADAILYGTINNYKLEPIAFDTNEVVTQYKLTMSVELDFEDKISKEMLWKEPNIYEYVNYFPLGSGGAPETEQDAFERLADVLSKDIVRRTVEGWW